MKLEPDNKHKIPYSATVTVQFELYMSKKEIEDGAEIPHELIVAGIVNRLGNKEYDVQEDEM